MTIASPGRAGASPHPEAWKRGFVMSRWSKIASLFVLSGLLASSACVVQAEQPPGNGRTGVTAEGSLSFVRSGGFADVYHQIDVDFATKRIQVRSARGAEPTEAILTDQDLASITTAVAAADIPHTRGPYVCKTCADQFLYDLTLVTGRSRYQAHWEDATSAPLELFKLGTLLRDIASRNFTAPLL